MCKFSDLNCKEVICVCDGKRLGFVSDAELELPEGNITAVIVTGPCRFLGLCGKRDDYVIPWRCIKRVGPDILLVDARPEDCRRPHRKPIFPF